MPSPSVLRQVFVFVSRCVCVSVCVGVCVCVGVDIRVKGNSFTLISFYVFQLFCPLICLQLGRSTRLVSLMLVGCQATIQRENTDETEREKKRERKKERRSLPLCNL